MSEEVILTEQPSDNGEKLQDFKHVCLCLGMMMIIVFVSRIAASIIGALLVPYFAQMELLTAYILESVLSFVFLYVIPITGALIIFRQKGLLREIYQKPAYASSAMGMFPAFYGIAIFANLITIFLGITIGTRMVATDFLSPATLLILGLGLFAFIFDTAGGVLFAKFLNLFSKKKLNPMIGAAGISAFPMSGRIVHKMGLKEDPQNFLLMHSIGVNVSGQIASVIAGGLILQFFL